jgi:hypothetical protein
MNRGDVECGPAFESFERLKNCAVLYAPVELRRTCKYITFIYIDLDRFSYMWIIMRSSLMDNGCKKYVKEH